MARQTPELKSPPSRPPQDETRAMRNFRLAGELFDFAFAVKLHQLRQKHPDWSLERLRQETIKLIEAGCR